MSQQIAQAVEEQSTESNGIKQNMHRLSAHSHELNELSIENTDIGNSIVHLTDELHAIALQFSQNK